MQAFAPTTVHSGQTQTLVLFTGAKSAQTSRTKVRNARQRKLQCHASLEAEGSASVKEKKKRDFGLGDILGPIGLTLGGSLNKKVRFILLDKSWCTEVDELQCCHPPSDNCGQVHNRLHLKASYTGRTCG